MIWATMAAISSHLNMLFGRRTGRSMATEWSYGNGLNWGCSKWAYVSGVIMAKQMWNKFHNMYFVLQQEPPLRSHLHDFAVWSSRYADCGSPDIAVKPLWWFRICLPRLILQMVGPAIWQGIVARPPVFWSLGFFWLLVWPPLDLGQ